LPLVRLFDLVWSEELLGEAKSSLIERTDLRLREGCKIVRMIVESFDEKTARAWLFGTNTRLDDVAPIDVLRRAEEPAQFAAVRAAAGVPMRTLQEWMGHRDIKTTLIYADYAPSAQEKEMVEKGLQAGGPAGDSTPLSVKRPGAWILAPVAAFPGTLRRTGDAGGLLRKRQSPGRMQAEANRGIPD
jgi:hypothetical protein